MKKFRLKPDLFFWIFAVSFGACFWLPVLIGPLLQDDEFPWRVLSIFAPVSQISFFIWAVWEIYDHNKK